VRVRRSSNKPRIVSLVVLGLVRARRGDPNLPARACKELPVDQIAPVHVPDPYFDV